MAPMTRSMAGPSRIANEINESYYSDRASAGLIITGGSCVSEVAEGWRGTASMYTAEHRDGWKKVVDAVHANGGRICLQLWHTGRVSHTVFHPGKQSVAPSAIKIENEEKMHGNTKGEKVDIETPRALRTDEVSGVAEEFGQAARLAYDAGFDFVEIHGANGYLIDEFLQSRMNTRKDKYGGSIVNRFRFVAEVLEAVSRSFPLERVGIRIAPNGTYNDMGSEDNFEMFSYALQQFDELKLCWVHITETIGGSNELGERLTFGDIRKNFSGTVIANGGFKRDTADQFIDEGFADLVSFGQSFICNPDLVEKFKNDIAVEESSMSDWYVSRPDLLGRATTVISVKAKEERLRSRWVPRLYSCGEDAKEIPSEPSCEPAKEIPCGSPSEPSCEPMKDDGHVEELVGRRRWPERGNSICIQRRASLVASRRRCSTSACSTLLAMTPE